MDFLRKIFDRVSATYVPARRMLPSNDRILPDGKLLSEHVAAIKARTDLTKNERHKMINTLYEWVRIYDDTFSRAVSSDTRIT